VAEVMAAEGYKVQPPPRVQRHDIIQVFLSLLTIIWSVGLVFSHIKTDKKGSLCSKHKLTEIVFCINLDRQCNLAPESVFWHSVQQCKSAVLLELILGQLLARQLVMSQK
jgi:hypothetical protein